MKLISLFLVTILCFANSKASGLNKIMSADSASISSFNKELSESFNMSLDSVSTDGDMRFFRFLGNGDTLKVRYILKGANISHLAFTGSDNALALVCKNYLNSQADVSSLPTKGMEWFVKSYNDDFKFSDKKDELLWKRYSFEKKWRTDKSFFYLITIYS